MFVCRLLGNFMIILLQVNLSHCSNADSMKTVLLQDPHILVGTPSSILSAVKNASLSLEALSLLILDEADLQFTYGFSGDIAELRQSFPSVKQTILMSATMSSDVKSLCLHLNDPVTLDVTATAAQVRGELHICSLLGKRTSKSIIT